MCFIFILVFILVLLLFYRKVYTVYFLHKNVLSKRECEELIHMSKKYTLETKPDGVDNKPEYQVDIYDSNQIVIEDLYKKAMNIYNNYIKKRLTYVKHPD